MTLPMQYWISSLKVLSSYSCLSINSRLDRYLKQYGWCLYYRILNGAKGGSPLWGRTYLYGLYEGVSPPRGRVLLSSQVLPLPFSSITNLNSGQLGYHMGIHYRKYIQYQSSNSLSKADTHGTVEGLQYILQKMIIYHVRC